MLPARVAEGAEEGVDEAELGVQVGVVHVEAVPVEQRVRTHAQAGDLGEINFVVVVAAVVTEDGGAA